MLHVNAYTVANARPNPGYESVYEILQYFEIGLGLACERSRFLQLLKIDHLETKIYLDLILLTVSKFQPYTT